MPETALVFSLFQFLLSGLIFLVSSFLLIRRSPRTSIRPLSFLVTAFLLYSGSRLLETLENLEAVTGGLLWHPLYFSLSTASRSLVTGALFCLVFVYLPHWIPRRRVRLAFLLVGLLLFVLGATYVSREQASPGGGAALQGALDVALIGGTCALYLRRRGMRGLFTASPLLVLLLSQIVGLPAAPEALPGTLENVLTLASLVLFALVMDRKSGNLYVQVFVRLNVIFVLLACGLILTITETERKHYLSLAEWNLQDLSEFLRGHVLYFWRQGLKPEEIVIHPEIAHKIVAEYGRVPALRRVRIFLGDTGMEMSIAPDGTVDQRLVQPRRWPSPPRPGLGKERIMTIVELPILSQKQELGRIELDESLQTINARMANQMLTVFLAFTVMALVSGTLIGLTVRDANRTIRRQYQELEKADQQLFHAAKLASVGQLADGIAHEINNPAGIILTRSEYLASVVKAGDSLNGIHEDVEVIRRQARRIAEIVGGLLTFSRPSALQMQGLDLNSLMTECLALLSPKLYARNIQVHCEMDKGLPAVSADPNRLEQVFVNILNNAIEAMPQGGQVTVATGVRPGKEVCVRVSDTGEGIAAEDLAKVFDPFFTRKQPGRGTGLGLSVSYGIVRDHKGRIEVASSLGQGTTFQVILPRREAPDEQL